MKRFFTLPLLIVILASCSKDLQVDTSPKGDFELCFEYLKNDYSYRNDHPFTMEELRKKYLPEIEASNTKTTLATVLVNIENELRDPHLYFTSDEVYDFSQVSRYDPGLEEISPTLYDLITISRETSYYTYGVVRSEPDIGYIYIRSFNDDVGGISSLGIVDGIKEIDDIVQELKNKGVQSMILDMRSTAGGSHYVPRYIAQRFVDKEATHMIEYYQQGKSFVRKEWKIKPEGTGFRTGKVAVLSNGLTASGGEMFVLGILQRDNVVHIGSNSAGAAGNIVDKDLSNGWNLRITNSKTELPDGTQYFKVGITPQIIVKNSYLNSTDKVLERAIQELQ